MNKSPSSAQQGRSSPHHDSGVRPVCRSSDWSTGSDAPTMPNGSFLTGQMFWARGRARERAGPTRTPQNRAGPVRQRCPSAGELRPPHVASRGLAEPRGLRGDCLVIRLQRGQELDRLRTDTLDHALGIPPGTGPGRITVTVDVDGIGHAQDAWRPGPRGGLVGTRDRPERGVTPGPEATATR